MILKGHLYLNLENITNFVWVWLKSWKKLKELNEFKEKMDRNVFGGVLIYKVSNMHSTSFWGSIFGWSLEIFNDLIDKKTAKSCFDNNLKSTSNLPGGNPCGFSVSFHMNNIKIVITNKTPIILPLDFSQKTKFGQILKVNLSNECLNCFCLRLSMFYSSFWLAQSRYGLGIWP